MGMIIVKILLNLENYERFIEKLNIMAQPVWKRSFFMVSESLLMIFHPEIILPSFGGYRICMVFC